MNLLRKVYWEMLKKMKVVRVTKTEFELEDGRIVPHFMELEKVPTLKQFQKIYDEWTDKLNAINEGEDDAKK